MIYAPQEVRHAIAGIARHAATPAARAWSDSAQAMRVHDCTNCDDEIPIAQELCGACRHELNNLEHLLALAKEREEEELSNSQYQHLVWRR